MEGSSGETMKDSNLAGRREEKREKPTVSFCARSGVKGERPLALDVP